MTNRNHSGNLLRVAAAVLALLANCLTAADAGAGGELTPVAKMEILLVERLATQASTGSLSTKEVEELLRQIVNRPVQKELDTNLSYWHVRGAAALRLKDEKNGRLAGTRLLDAGALECKEPAVTAVLLELYKLGWAQSASELEAKRARADLLAKNPFSQVALTPFRGKPGVRGIDGSSGSDGDLGDDGPPGTETKVTGGDGSRGMAGGNGKDGGSGTNGEPAPPLSVNIQERDFRPFPSVAWIEFTSESSHAVFALEPDKTHAFDLRGGNGGNGGKGGDGGKGGRGGEGGNGYEREDGRLTRGGRGGDGGHGGNGGQGGQPGSGGAGPAISITVEGTDTFVESVKKNLQFDVRGGEKGTPGSGGKAGKGGRWGSPGNDKKGLYSQDSRDSMFGNTGIDGNNGTTPGLESVAGGIDGAVNWRETRRP